jgi:hypothetical protein
MVGVLGLLLAAGFGSRRAGGQLAAPGADGRAARAWSASLSELEAAVATRDRQRAIRAWEEAWRAALGVRRWEALAAVGDMALAVGELAGAPEPARARARRAYRAALFRARDAGAVDGVLRAAEAFAGLGDAAVAEGALGVARGLAARGADGELRARVELTAANIAARGSGAP